MKTLNSEENVFRENFMRSKQKNGEVSSKLARKSRKISKTSDAFFFEILRSERKGAKACTSCRSRQELSNEYLLAKFGFDTAGTFRF